MEVNAVRFGRKGKGKSKNNSKGKKGSRFGLSYGGKSGGGSKGVRKGKSKKKGKKGGKGKNKGKYQKGKGYGGGASNNNVCRLCGQYGHWGNDCPLKNNVIQVNSARNGEAQAPLDASSTVGSTSTRRTSTTSTTSQPLSSGSKVVRLVKMYHVATPPAKYPQIYELRSDVEEELEKWSVRMVAAQRLTACFRLDGDDDDQCDHAWRADPLMDWYHDFQPGLDWYQGFKNSKETQVPTSAFFLTISVDVAQRNQVATRSLKMLKDDFIVASVQSRLISLGRLLHRGWSLVPGDTAGAKVNLISADGDAAIPLQFKRNSLAVYASIRVVSAHEVSEAAGASSSSSRRSTTPRCEPEHEVVKDENDMMAIQVVITPHEEMWERIHRRGWKTTRAVNPIIIMPDSKNYLNPGISYSRHEWPLRSIAIQRDDFSWELVEFCNQYYLEDDFNGGIEEFSQPTMVLTMLQKKGEPTEVVGVVGQQEMAEVGGAQVEPFLFPEELGICMEIQDGLKPEEMAQADPQPADDAAVPALTWKFENKDSLVVNGDTIFHNSSMALLKAAADFLASYQLESSNYGA
eukprot:s3453_g8.t1